MSSPTPTVMCCGPRTRALDQRRLAVPTDDSDSAATSCRCAKSLRRAGDGSGSQIVQNNAHLAYPDGLAADQTTQGPRGAPTEQPNLSPYVRTPGSSTSAHAAPGAGWHDTHGWRTARAPPLPPVASVAHPRCAGVPSARLLSRPMPSLSARCAVKPAHLRRLVACSALPRPLPLPLPRRPLPPLQLMVCSRRALPLPQRAAAVFCLACLSFRFCCSCHSWVPSPICRSVGLCHRVV